MYTKKQRVRALFVTAMLCFAVLFSFLFTLKETNHSCTGEECPICTCLHQAEETLRQISGSRMQVLAVVFGTVFFSLVCAEAFRFFITTSLVSQKVRLDN